MKSMKNAIINENAIELLHTLLENAVHQYAHTNHETTYPLELQLSQTLCDYVESIDDFNLYYAERSLVFDNENELIELHQLSQSDRPEFHRSKNKEPIAQSPPHFSAILQRTGSPVLSGASCATISPAPSKRKHEEDEQSSSIELGDPGDSYESTKRVK